MDRFAEEGDSGASASTGFESDDAFYGHHVSVSPEADLFFDIEEFFGHFIGGPVLAGGTVDFLEGIDDLGMLFVRLGVVSIEDFLWNGESGASEICEKFFVKAGGIEAVF